MIINLYKYRYIIALVIILLAAIPLVYKYGTVPEKQIPRKEIKKNLLCGEFLTWDEVNSIFPKYSRATVIDYDTRLKFRVQRRGGTYHADVQPLTADDTSIMKKIYNGQWSWKRKAVIIQLDSGKKIAASMNGMPHGQGAIERNNFNGHFCIHFRDSITHGSRKLNLAHQIMIWKSANILDQKLQGLNQQQVIEVFVTAVEQGAMDIAGKTINSGKDVRPLLKVLSTIEYIRIGGIEKVKENSFSVELYLVFKNSKKEISRNLLVTTRRIKSCWKIDAQSLEPLVDTIR
ncbi:MAG: hypothetical protein ABFD18_16940 [Syntrophomonas sp.]